MKLYGFPISPNSKRVHVCAAELGLPLDVQNLDFAAGEQRAPAYLALNPMGKVPTVTDGDFALWESAAILCHLGASRPGALWPVEARAQAHVLQWLFFTSCHLDPHFTTLVVERFIKPRRGASTDEARVAAALAELGRFLAIVEGQLTGRDYLTGTFTVADIAAGCTVELASLVLVDLAPHPHTRAWLARLGARASWRSAAPAIAA
jgi:glutathione S-transferase